MACLKQTKGFSLLELLIVIALVGILMSIASTQFVFFRKALVKTEIEKLYTICSYLRQLAQIRNRPCTLVFDRKNGTYRYENMVEVLPKQIVFGALKGALGPPSAPHKAIITGITFPNDTIVFHPSGIIDAGTVYMVDERSSYMGALSCAVSHFSYLRKYFYTNRWQLFV